MDVYQITDIVYRPLAIGQFLLHRSDFIFKKTIFESESTIVEFI